MPLQTDIKRALAHFFSALADFAPSWFATKFKIHVMAHIADCVDRFSLLKLYHEEPFESHNTPMRNASVYSNRHAASQHIGSRMNRAQQIRRLLCGGFYISKSASTGLPGWEQAAPAVLTFMLECKPLQRVYGIEDLDLDYTKHTGQ
jgi:hypothetical protein